VCGDGSKEARLLPSPSGERRAFPSPKSSGEWREQRAEIIVLYGRASSHEQKEDLQRQVQHLQQWAEVWRTGQKTMTLTDIGSGLGSERKNLQRVLALVQDSQVAEVVVTFSDRLTRFGHTFLHALFSGDGVTLTVLHADEEKTPEQELVDDLLAIIASFAGRMSGLRERKQKALSNCAKQVLAALEQ
jgi:putative resolvase